MLLLLTKEFGKLSRTALLLPTSTNNTVGIKRQAAGSDATASERQHMRGRVLV